MKPKDIPQGVWDAAEKVADELAAAFVPEKYIMTISRAIMAEREACAVVAQEMYSLPGWRPDYKRASVSIASKIRSRP